jgi:hypothetical protein
MTRFLVHTDLVASQLDPAELNVSVPKMLSEAKLSNVALKQAYVCRLTICHCVNDRKVMCEFDSTDEATVRSALTKIGLPLTAILAKPN